MFLTNISSNYNKKVTVCVLYPCYICGSPYTKGPFTLEHITSVHSQNLPKRRMDWNQPKHRDYTYVDINGADWGEIHYGCSSCWLHTNGRKKLQVHVKNKHGPDIKNGNDRPNDKTFVHKILKLGEMLKRIL